jgi:hypothetical protein
MNSKLYYLNSKLTFLNVIPVKTGNQKNWFPACAGTTADCRFRIFRQRRLPVRQAGIRPMAEDIRI